MPSVNKIILVGNLGRKPELRDSAGGQLATFSLATSRTWTGKDGQKQEATTWHRVNVWGNQAAMCERYLDKGSQVYVEGSCEQREFTDKDGQPAKIFAVRAQTVQFLGGRQTDQGGGSGQQRQVHQQMPSHRPASGFLGEGYGAAPAADEDIPF